MQNSAPPIAPRLPYLIESVDHAMSVLLQFQSRRELRVTDVANQLGVSRSTAHRLLSTLAWRGFVAQDRVGKSYRAGRVLVEIGLNTISGLDVRRKAHRHLESLASSLHETVNLLVLEGGGCRFIDGVEGSQAVRVSVRTGTLLPAYATAGGKVLIAGLDSGELRELYPNGLQKVTDKTKTDFATLELELAKVRERGYAINVDESELGLRATAVPIKDRLNRPIAALAVATPAERMTSVQLPGLLKQLTEAAERITDDLH